MEYLRSAFVAAFGMEWSLLDASLVKGRLRLTTITPEGVTVDEAPADAELGELLDLACAPSNRLATFRDLPFLRGRAAKDWAPLRALADRLLPPGLQARLHPTHRLAIASGESLRALPWAALRLGDGWLCERAVIQMLPLSEAAPKVAPLAADNPLALLLGCAAFGGRAPELPQADAMLDAAAGRWPGPALRPPAPLTRRAFLALDEEGQFARARLIHIASHGRRGEPEASAHIKLADGDVRADEVARLRLRGALVVLALCSGAAGEEALSLADAFVAAGAGGVVASLWPIYGAASLRLFELFYAALADGRDPALALATAQRALAAHSATSDEDITATPFVWGGFGYTGIP